MSTIAVLAAAVLFMIVCVIVLPWFTFVFNAIFYWPTSMLIRYFKWCEKTQSRWMQ